MAREKILGIQEGSTGWANISITGPSVLFTLGKRNTFSITTRGRVFANYWDVDGRLAAEVEETERVDQTYPYSVTPGKKMMTNVAAWSDFVLGFSRYLLVTEKHILKGGINLHYLTGLAHSSYDVRLNGGTVDLAPSYITGATGTINALNSGQLFNSRSPANLFKGNGSFSGDFGLSYQYRSDQTKPYTLKIGLSITDIGGLSYSPDTVYSKSYDITIASPRSLYFNEQLSNVTFNHISIAFDRNPNSFKRKSVNTQNYNITLPTQLRLFADYQITSQYGLRGDLSAPLTSRHTTSSLQIPANIALTPRFEHRNLSVFLPLSYQNYTGFNTGVALGIGGFYIGSGSLLSSLVTHSRQMELYAGITITPGKNRSNKTSSLTRLNGGQIISQKKPGNQSTTSNSINELPGSVTNTPLYKQIHGFVSIGLFATSNNTVPLWMRSRQYGSIPLDGISTSVIAGAHKDYDTLRTHKLLDWGAAAEARINGGNTMQAILVEAYAKGRMGIFQLKAGRSKEFMGLVDSTLSSGAFAVSGNALGIPKIELSVPDYWPLPYTKGLFAFKGNLAHGWFGEQVMNFGPAFKSLIDPALTYFHQKSLYGRLGKPSWRVKFYAGFNHQVMWGSEDKIFLNFGLSKLETFKYILTGKAYGDLGTPNSKVGNHVGSIDQGIEFKFKNSLLTGYHQFFYDAGALYHFANATDGIWGASLKNTKKVNANFYWKKFLLEIISSKSQGGEPDSKPRPSGAEDYYNNWEYLYGWAYLEANIGNPLFTTKKYIRTGLPKIQSQYFNNNRIIALHTGAEFSYSQWQFKTLFTWSSNYGTYATSPATRGDNGVIEYHNPPYFGQVNQFSGYFEASRPLKNGYSLSFALAADQGKLLNNSVGGFIKITRSW